jgi:hypothetical protein
MARKTNHELDSKLAHELEVARYLAVAFIAQSHGIGMDYALAKSMPTCRSVHFGSTSHTR